MYDNIRKLMLESAEKQKDLILKTAEQQKNMISTGIPSTKGSRYIVKQECEGTDYGRPAESVRSISKDTGDSYHPVD